MDSEEGKVTLAVLKRDIQQLNDEVVRLRNVVEIKVESLGERVRAIELCRAAEAAGRADVAKLQKWRDEVDTLLPWLRALAWIGGAVGISLLGLIWSLITGQATIVIP